MKKQRRVAKTDTRKLQDLDDHLFLLRSHLHHLNEDAAHLKVIAAELRVLLCISSGNEGLLWRLVEKLGVSDELYLHIIGNVNPQHPLAKDLNISFIPIQRGGLGDPNLPPNYYSLKEIIKNFEAVFVLGKGLTHEYIIKAVAQQMGSAHEDDGVEPSLVELGKLFINGVQPYIPILAIDAELALQVGERVIEKAEHELGFVRRPRIEVYGDLSIMFRLGLKKHLFDTIPLFKFWSDISEVEIHCLAGHETVSFDILKKDATKKEIHAKYPSNWDFNSDVGFIFSYSSRAKQAHAITNGKPQDQGIQCDIGWVHASELHVDINKGSEEFLRINSLLLYNRLLSPEDVLRFIELPPNLEGLWKFEDEINHQGIFPP